MNKITKKLLPTALAAVLCAGMVVPAMAAEAPSADELANSVVAALSESSGNEGEMQLSDETNAKIQELADQLAKELTDKMSEEGLDIPAEIPEDAEAPAEVSEETPAEEETVALPETVDIGKDTVIGTDADSVKEVLEEALRDRNVSEFSEDEVSMFEAYMQENAAEEGTADDEVASEITIAIFGTEDCGENVGIGTEENATHKDCSTILLVTIDKDNEEVRLASILPDTVVPMGEYGEHRLGRAYEGGADFALGVINENFGTNIDKYMTVDANNIKNAIDYIGGVDIAITAEELSALGMSLEDVEAGKVHLDSEKAAEFMALELPETDTVRTNRMREVLGAMFDQEREAGILEQIFFAIRLLAGTDASVGIKEISSLVDLATNNYEIYECVIPDFDFETDLSGHANEDGEWVWAYNLTNASDRMNEFLGSAQGEGTKEVTEEVVEEENMEGVTTPDGTLEEEVVADGIEASENAGSTDAMADGRMTE